jgi:hypothetical protein
MKIFIPVLIVVLIAQFEWMSALNPCDYKKCKKNEVPCLEVVAKSNFFFLIFI